MMITSFVRRCEKVLRANQGRMSARPRLVAAVEAIEGRVMLSVTSTTPGPVSVIGGSAVNGILMNFTANDGGPFTATIDWGDGSPTNPGAVGAQPGGFFVQPAL